MLVVVLGILILMIQAGLSLHLNRPNVVFILTDDLDVRLGGMTPLEKTRRLIGEAGMTFTNAFVSTPLCCPSRASILTGRYQHNHRVYNNSVSGGCSSKEWRNGPEKLSFAHYLKERGYNTFYAGKYLNQYGKRRGGGVKHMPVGWKTWMALVGNSVYYNYKLSVNGTPEKHGNEYNKDYLTDLIARGSSEFLRKQTPTVPFLMVLAPPAPHAPFTSAPQYERRFRQRSPPKNGSYNIHGKDKHWLLRKAQSPMSAESVDVADNTFRKRWRTLLSVDDLVESVVIQLTNKKLINNTYIFFSSDNGYHLGQFCLPIDKRQLYDFDLRVPLLVRGPGIPPATVSNASVLNIDFAPTFLAIAGVQKPLTMDGISVLPLLSSEKENHNRKYFLIEHRGEGVKSVRDCPQYDDQYMKNCYPDCVCEDSWNNSYTCTRIVTTKRNFKYCRIHDNENFTEAYNFHNDPDELTNLAASLNSMKRQYFERILQNLSTCAGESCQIRKQKLRIIKYSYWSFRFDIYEYFVKLKRFLASMLFN